MATKNTPIKGKQLTKQPLAKMSKPKDVKISAKEFKGMSDRLDARQRAASKKKTTKGAAKLAAGAAGTAAAMYYGLTKQVGGIEQKDAQGRVTGKTRRRRVPIWSKDQGY